MRKVLVGFGMVLLLTAAFAMSGCDKAEQALEKTDLGSTAEITKLVGNGVKTLGGITDLESARAALPALKDMDLDLGKLVQKVKDMSPEQKSKLTGAVAKVMPQFEGAIAQVMSLAGVGDVVGPTLDSLKSKLASIK